MDKKFGIISGVVICILLSYILIINIPASPISNDTNITPNADPNNVNKESGDNSITNIYTSEDNEGSVEKNQSPTPPPKTIAKPVPGEVVKPSSTQDHNI